MRLKSSFSILVLVFFSTWVITGCGSHSSTAPSSTSNSDSNSDSGSSPPTNNQPKSKVIVTIDQLSLLFTEGSLAMINVQLNEKRSIDTLIQIELGGESDFTQRFNALSSGNLLKIPGGSLSAPIIISSADDLIYQGTKNYSLKISSTDTDLEIQYPEISITLLDNELPPKNDTTPNIRISDITISENSTATLTVILSHAYSSPIIVEYNSSNGSATLGDYTPLIAGQLIFPPGTTAQSLTINAAADGLAEPTENYFVTLSNPTAGSLDKSVGEVTINNVDTDPTINLANVTVAENNVNGFVTMTATLSGPSSKPITAAYSTSNGVSNGSGIGGATAGSDFTSTSGSLSFAFFETTKTFNVPILNDAIYDGTKNFSVTLDTPTKATLGTPSATITITDDEGEPALTWTASNLSALESAGTATLTAQLSHLSAFTTKINFVLTGTAANTVDYSLTPTAISIPPGQTTQNITVTLIDDSTTEPDETLIATLDSPLGATLGNPSAITLTLNNDDLGVFSISGITGSNNLDTNADGYLNADTHAVVSWGASSGAIHYQVTLYEDDNTTIKCATQTTISTNFDFASCNLTPGSFYRAKVLAYNEAQNITHPASNNPYRFLVNRNPTMTDLGPWYVMSNSSITLQALHAASPAVGTASDGDLVNDVGQALTFSLASQGTLGTVSNSGSSLLYTPNSTTSTGVDTLAVTISDGAGGTVSGNITIHVVTAYTWTGNTSNTWNNSTATNWCGAINTNKTGCTGSGAVPGASNTAIIDNTCVSVNCSPTTNYNVNVAGLKIAGNTLNQGTGFSITVGASSFLQTSGTFNGSDQNATTDNITYNNGFTISGGTYKATRASTVFKAGTFSGSPSFNANQGTFEFNDALSTFTSIVSVELNHLLIKRKSNFDFKISGSIVVNGDLTLYNDFDDAETFNQLNRTNATDALIAKGNVYTKGYGIRGTALIKMAGSANQSLIATDAIATGSTERWIPSLEIASTGGTVSWFGNFRIRSNYAFTSGTLNAGSSTLVFENRNDTVTLRPGGPSVLYNNVTVRTSGGVLNMNSGDVMKILGTLTLDNSYSFGASINNGTLEAHGNVILSEYGIKGNGKVKMAGDSNAGDVNQTIDASGATQGWLPELEIATNNLSVSLLGNLYVFGNYTWTSGTVVAGTSTLIFDSFNGTRTHTPGVPTYNHITFTGSAGAHNINGTMKVGGNLTLENVYSLSGTLNGGAIDIYGNLIATNYGYTSGNTALTMKGSASATISQSSSSAGFPSNIAIAKDSSTNPAVTVTLASHLSLSKAGLDLTLQSGMLDLAGYALTINDVFTLNAGTTLYTGCGSYSPSSGAKFVNNGTIVSGSNVGATVADVSVSETGNAVFNVNLSAASCAAVQFNYATSNGSALAGTNYTASSGSISLSAGLTSTSITVPTLDNGCWSGSSNQFNLTLSSITGAYLADNLAAGTITENTAQPSIQFAANLQTVAEDAGLVTATVQRTGASCNSTSVPFTVGGSATGGASDYAIAASPITLAVGGNLSSNININIIDDTTYEVPENIILTLSATADASLGTNTVHTLTITDNDLGPFSISGVQGASDTASDAYLNGSSYPDIYFGSSTNATHYSVAIYADDGTTLKCAPVSEASNHHLFTAGECTGPLSGGTYYKASVSSTDSFNTKAASNNLYRFYVNQAPTLTNLGPWYVLSSSSITIDALYAPAPAVGTASDSDIVNDNSQILNFSLAANGSYGSVTNNGTSLVYTPTSTTSTGKDTIAVTVSDGVGGTVSGNIPIHVVTPYTWTGNTSNTWNNTTTNNWCGTINTNKTGCAGGGTLPGSSNTAIVDSTCSSGNCSPTTNYNLSLAGFKLAGATFNQGNGFTLTVGASGFTQTGGTFNGSDATININGLTSITGGIFKSTSGTAKLDVGNLTITAPATFDANFGTVEINGVGTIDTEGVSFYKLSFIAWLKSYGFSNRTFTVLNDLTLGNPSQVTNTVQFNNGTIQTKGNVYVNKTGTNGEGSGGTAVVLVNGNTDQTISCYDSNSFLPAFRIQSTGGNVIFGPYVNIGTSGYYEYLSGSVTTTNSTLLLTNGTTAKPGNVVYNNVTISGWQINLDLLGGTFIINGNYSQNQPTSTGYTKVNNGTLEVHGNATAEVLAQGGTATLHFMGDGKTMTLVGGGSFPNTDIDVGESGTLTITGTGGFGFGSNGTFRVLSAASATTTGSSVSFSTASITPGSFAFNNVTLASWLTYFNIYNNPLKVNGNLTVGATGVPSQVSSGTIELQGNFTNVYNLSNESTATLKMYGCNKSITNSNQIKLKHIYIDPGPGCVTTQSGNYATTTGGSVTVNSGEYRMMGYSLTTDTLWLNSTSLYKGAGPLTVGGFTVGEGSLNGGVISNAISP